MTPQEKAHALWIDFRSMLSLPGAPLGDHKDEIAKTCAIHVVNEILIAMPVYPSAVYLKWQERQNQANQYWEEVKTEIEKL
jgi:hypothetical protein